MKANYEAALAAVQAVMESDEDWGAYDQPMHRTTARYHMRLLHAGDAGEDHLTLAAAHLLTALALTLSLDDSAPGASNVSEKRIVSGKLEISSRNILRRVPSGLLHKFAPASTGASKT
jgi:hypothetical protein